MSADGGALAYAGVDRIWPVVATLVRATMAALPPRFAPTVGPALMSEFGIGVRPKPWSEAGAARQSSRAISLGRK